MNATRYIYKTVPILRKDAEIHRCQEMQDVMNQILSLQNELKSLQKLPLPTTRQVPIELNPGDEGYEDAPYEVNFVKYQGNVTWQNIENSTGN